MADRQELCAMRFRFCQIQTRNYPLTQRVAFLESKGLTNAEIEQVLQQVAQTPSSPATPSQVPYGSPAPYAVPPNFAVVPQVPQRDWRDYFIMAVVSGGVMFGIVSLAQIRLATSYTPSATAYEADRDALTAQFDAAAELIKDIQSEAAASRSIVEEQREKVDSALNKLQIAINETKEGESRAKADLREIRDEVNNVRDMLPKVGLQ
ncbi:hypothetical protein BS47DRAFT_1393778 [Hydnum rufescens UP504]|uniref:Peroxisomal membrane protein PEX14 n=1 Tax=Hydnum rufescens UP504 TaxID=1448309 RepID=A0A9P6AVT7_9AGAM|nr:hypothetical protein BS47DRAFT_1393778 [Hydnum rufescens UP504]